MKLLLQLADTLVEKGHAHAPNIKQWVEEVGVDNILNYVFSSLILLQMHRKQDINVKHVGVILFFSDKQSEP